MSFDRDPELRSAAPVVGIFPRLYDAFYCVYKSNRVSVPRISHKKTATSRDIIARYKEECLHVHWPESLEEVKRVTEEFQYHYNEQRPHQGQAGGNQPPLQAFPTLPKLPPLPRTVQADRWLWRYHHRAFARLVGSDGCVSVHHETYYISNQMSGQQVALVVDAPTASFDVMAGAKMLKRLPIKHVVWDELPLEQFIELMRSAGSFRAATPAGLTIALAASEFVGPYAITRNASEWISSMVFVMAWGHEPLSTWLHEIDLSSEAASE